MPADDLTDPAPATTFAHLDATTVLSRQIAELGIYPAVDPLDSTSRGLLQESCSTAGYCCEATEEGPSVAFRSRTAEVCWTHPLWASAITTSHEARRRSSKTISPFRTTQCDVSTSFLQFLFAAS